MEKLREFLLVIPVGTFYYIDEAKRKVFNTFLKWFSGSKRTCYWYKTVLEQQEEVKTSLVEGMGMLISLYNKSMYVLKPVGRLKRTLVVLLQVFLWLLMAYVPMIHIQGTEKF